MDYLFKFEKEDIESKIKNKKTNNSDRKSELYRSLLRKALLSDGDSAYYKSVLENASADDIKAVQEDLKTEKHRSLLSKALLDDRKTFKINIEKSRKTQQKSVEIYGRIEFGVINRDDIIRFNGKSGKVESIKCSGRLIDTAGYPWTKSEETAIIEISGIENEPIYHGLQVIDIVKSASNDKKQSDVALMSVPVASDASNNDDFSMEISDVFTIKGRGVVFAGRILNGEISVGDMVDVDGKQYTVAGIEKFRRLLDRATANDGEIGLLIGGLKREDAKTTSIVKKVNVSNRTATVPPTYSNTDEKNSNSTINTGGAKERFVRIKPKLPIMVKDAPIRQQNPLMKAISKIYGTANGSIEYDGFGDITKIETDSRIYIVNGVDAPHGLLLYVDMNDASWRRNFRDIVNLYKYEYAGNFDPTVITVINSSMSDNLEVKELEEMELRDSLNDLGLRGDDYPVIFCEVDKINNATEIQKGGKLHRSIVEAIVALDEYFVTP